MDMDDIMDESHETGLWIWMRLWMRLDMDEIMDETGCDGYG
jgi:hypothetical protein